MSRYSWYTGHKIRGDEGAYYDRALTGGNDRAVMNITIKVDGDENDGHLT